MGGGRAVEGKDQGKGKDKGKRGSQGKSGEGKTKGKFAVPMPDDQVLSCKWACNIRGYPEAGEENSWRSVAEVIGVENGHDIKLSGETGTNSSHVSSCAAHACARCSPSSSP